MRYGMNVEKYKLRLTLAANLSRLKCVRLTKNFEWEAEADALACKALLDKATLSGKGITSTVEFVRFTDEIPL